MKLPKRKERLTQLLEEYQIWFKTILSFALTGAAIAVSIASCSVASYQNYLTELAMKTTNLEKQPFFSINNSYDPDNMEYSYEIIRKGGEIRQANVKIEPILHFFIIHERKAYQDEFVLLHNYYNFHNGEDDDTLIVFNDRMVNNEHSNEYFQSYMGYYRNNVGDYYVSRIIYQVTVVYYNYKNEKVEKVFMLNRAAEMIIKENVLLFIDDELLDKYELAFNKGEVQEFVTPNYSADEIVKHIRSFIDEYAIRNGAVNKRSA